MSHAYSVANTRYSLQRHAFNSEIIMKTSLKPTVKLITY